MNYKFYTKALCALITCASMSIAASEITADKVITHIAQITNTNAQNIKDLNAGHAIELSKSLYKKEYQTILNAQSELYLHNSLVSFYKKCIGKKDMQSQAAQAMLENIFNLIYKTNIANAQIKEPQQAQSDKKRFVKTPITEEEFKKQQNEQDDLIASTYEANQAYKKEKNKSSKFGSYLKIGGITAATFIAIGLGYYWYKK